MATHSSSAPGHISAGFSLPDLALRVSDAAAALRAATISADPGSVELPLPRPPVDQRQVNCCVSCALGAAMEIISPGSPSLAPLFHYFITRQRRLGAQPDGSLRLDAAFTTLTIDGICRRELHDRPFTESGASTPPSVSALKDGKTRTLQMRYDLLPRYQPATTGSRAVWAREQLKLGRPVIVGFVLPSAYESHLGNDAFVWKDPESMELSNSGHCVVATGYHDARQALHIRDSRGIAAFDRGYWWMGYRVVDSNAVHSMYSLIP